MYYGKLRERQHQSEIESDVLAQRRALEKYVKWTNKGMVEAPKVKNMILATLPSLSSILQGVLDRPYSNSVYFPWLRKLDADQLSLIALKESIRVCMRDGYSTGAVKLSTSLGKAVVVEVVYKDLETSSPVYARHLESRVRAKAYNDPHRIQGFVVPWYRSHFGDLLDNPLISMDNKSFSHIGKYLLNALHEVGFLEVIDRGGYSSKVKLPDYIVDYFLTYEEDDVAKIIDKQDTAMVCPPDEWDSIKGGGYLTNRRKGIYLLIPTKKLRKSTIGDIFNEFTPQVMPRVFAHANWIQSIPLEIDQVTKQAIVESWKLDINCMGIPRRSQPIAPEFPLHETWSRKNATEEEMAAYRKWAHEISDYRSLVIKEWKVRNRIISEYLRSSNKPGPIWYPVFYDFRGRMYYRGKPNVQGEDIEKAVLHFHEKKPLGKRGLYWLKVAIANDYGYDKESYDDRVKWTEDHISDIRRAIKTPWDYPEVWGDNPFCMYSSCVQLLNALDSRDPESYVTGIPVRVDATCSGHQHFAALFRDPVAADLVNLTYRGSGGKSDIYTFIANAAMEKIKEDLNSPDEKTRHLANFAYQAGISRSMAKRPIMTQVYSATLHSAQEYVGEGLKDVLAEKGMDYPPDYSPMIYRAYIAKKLFASLEVAVPSAVHGMAWLKECAKEVCGTHGLVWTTPTGFKVHHDYQTYKDTRVRLNLLGMNLVTVRTYGEGVSKARVANAISPNFVHSLDASHLLMTAERMRRKGLQMQCIHDSFGTHPCDVDTLQRELREAFVELYSMPIAENFREEIGATIDYPEKGSLDIREVLDSPYFFC